MDIKWIEPAVRERINQVAAECDEQTEVNHEDLISIINNLKRVIPKSESRTLLKLEDLYIQGQLKSVDFGYRKGLEDGMQVHRLCNNKKHPFE